MRIASTYARRGAALALTGALAFGAAACGDDVVDDGVEEEVEDAATDAEDAATDLGDAASEGADDVESEMATEDDT